MRRCSSFMSPITSRLPRNFPVTRSETFLRWEFSKISIKEVDRYRRLSGRRPVWKSKGLDPLGGCSGFVTEPSRGKAGRQQWVPQSCAIRLIPLGCNRGRGNVPAFKQAYPQRCGNQVNQRRQYVSAEWPLMERGWGLGSGINTLFPKGSHQVKIKRFVGGRDAHETHCSHACCPVPCGTRDSISNG